MRSCCRRAFSSTWSSQEEKWARAYHHHYRDAGSFHDYATRTELAGAGSDRAIGSRSSGQAACGMMMSRLHERGDAQRAHDTRDAQPISAQVSRGSRQASTHVAERQHHIGFKRAREISGKEHAGILPGIIECPSGRPARNFRRHSCHRSE